MTPPRDTTTHEQYFLGKARPRRIILHALTIHRPWSWGIAQRFKPVENREWAPPKWQIGHPFAIHAGKTYDLDGAKWMHERARALGIEDVPGDEQLPPGNVVAVAILAGAVHFEQDELHDRHVLEVLGGLAQPRVEQILASPWTCGPWVWVLEDVVALPGVPCRGKQKLWQVPKDVRDQVREQYRVARAA